MKRMVFVLMAFLACLPTMLLADQIVYDYGFHFDEGMGVYVNATIYYSDSYPDLMFVEFGTKGIYAMANGGATNVYVPHEVYINPCYVYYKDEDGNIFSDPEYPEYYRDEVTTLEIMGADFDRNSGLVSIELEEGIEWVRCYKCTSLENAILPNTITDLSSTCWEDGYSLPGDDYDSGDYRSSYYGSFMGCSSLESIFIPYHVEKIDGAFIDCISLKNVTFGTDEWNESAASPISTMGFTFYGCSSLQKIEIPFGVSWLTETFMDCTSLVDVKIPSSVTNIGQGFRGCTSLTNTDFLIGKSNITNMELSFYGCTNLKTAIVPESVSTIENVFIDLPNLESVTIYSSKLKSMKNAFSGCRNLLRVETYDEDGKHSFENGVYIPPTVKNLEFAFSRCSKIEQVVFAKDGEFNNYDYSTQYAFSNCTNLNHVELSNMKRLSSGIFSSCRSLKDITIPESVEMIRDGAFNYCSSLETITFEGKIPPSVSQTAFSDSEQDKKASVPAGKLTSYKNAFKNCNTYNKKNGFGQIVFGSSPSEVIIVGDVNGDYQITIADVTALVNIILGKTDQNNQTAADVNGDGQITIADVTTLVNIILGKTTDNIPEYVDLGLPSGTLWATCNVGASCPEEFGDYFAWGETTGYDGGKDKFDWSTYQWCNGTSTTLTKYNTNASYGTTVDGKTELDLEDDAAYVNKGSEWRIPTPEQFKELINSEYTTTEWTRQEWAFGYKITSKANGNSIFLPAAGRCYYSIVSNEMVSGLYWSNSLVANNVNRVQYLHIGIDFSMWANSIYISFIKNGQVSNDRCYGASIRPVRHAE